MNLLDVNQLAGEVVSRDDLGFQAGDSEYRQRESVRSDDSAAVALAMVSEAAAAIRELEEKSAHAVASKTLPTQLANSWRARRREPSAPKRRNERLKRKRRN